MKLKVMFAAMLAFSTASATATFAQQQQPELPAPSPAATVKQRVGLTDVTVEYSSPAVNGRKIFGELVPYNEMWRTGANMATKVTFSRDAMVAGKAVPAGTYALFTIPTESEWTVILNKKAQASGTTGYDEKEDQARFTTKPATIPKRERMTFLFADTTDTTTSLDLEWDTLKLSIPIQVDTTVQAMANIDQALAAAWRPHASSARYLAENNGDLAKALTYIDKSIAIDENWFNCWIKADILSKTGKNKDAYAWAKKSYDLGLKADNFFWKDRVAKAMEDWKKSK